MNTDSALIKYNLASGNDYKEGYINVDNCSMFPECKTDLKADLREMIVIFNTVDEIRLSHFAMYLRPKEVVELLAKWYGWLKQGGKFELECIDIKKVSRIVASGQPQSVLDSWGLVNLYGNEQTKTHQWGWTAKSLTPLLFQAGFSEVKVKKGLKKPNRDFLIIATK